MKKYDAKGMTVAQVLKLNKEGIFVGETKEMIVAKCHNVRGEHYLYVVSDKEEN